MKTIAIITWCNEKINYGQVLQAYAMQQIVRRYGCEPLTIRYRRPSKDENVNWLRLPFMKKSYEWFRGQNMATSELWTVKSKFNSYVRKHIRQSVPCYTVHDIEKEIKKYDCNTLICGSDQIWNPVAFDPVYYLDFCNNKDMLRIAYAPSIAEDELNNKNKHIFDKMKKLVERLDHISVREETGAKILRGLINKPVYCLLDPTFLISKKGWDRIASKPLSSENYIFCYILGDIKQHRDKLNEITKKHNASKVIYLRTNSDMIYSNVEFIKGVGLEDFISLIKYAKAIYTDSFHGVAISINYNKEFYTSRRYNYSNYNKSSRIIHILKLFKLQNRYIERCDQIVKDDFINYNTVNMIISKERKRAFQFLDMALKKGK